MRHALLKDIQEKWQFTNGYNLNFVSLSKDKNTFFKGGGGFAYWMDSSVVVQSAIVCSFSGLMPVTEQPALITSEQLDKEV